MSVEIHIPADEEQATDPFIPQAGRIEVQMPDKLEETRLIFRMGVRGFFRPRSMVIGVEWEPKIRVLTIHPIPMLGIAVSIPRASFKRLYENSRKSRWFPIAFGLWMFIFGLATAVGAFVFVGGYHVEHQSRFSSPVMVSASKPVESLHSEPTSAPSMKVVLVEDAGVSVVVPSSSPPAAPRHSTATSAKPRSSDDILNTRY